MVAASEAFDRYGWPADARAYLLAATGVGAVSLCVASVGGFAQPHDPFGLVWLYAGYAALAFAVGWRTRRAAGGWVAWALLLAAVVQWLTSRDARPDAWMAGWLGYATLAAAARVWGGRLGEGVRPMVTAPARWAVLVASGFAALVLAGQLAEGPTYAVALRGAWLAALWLAIALAETSPAWFAAGQCATAAAVVAATFAQLRGRPWFASAESPLSDPRTWQWTAAALGLLGIAWSAARQLIPSPVTAAPSPRTDPQPIVKRPLPTWLGAARSLTGQTWTVDRLTLLLLGTVLVGLALFAVLPGVAAELRRSGETPRPRAVRRRSFTPRAWGHGCCWRCWPSR